MIISVTVQSTGHSAPRLLRSLPPSPNRPLPNSLARSSSASCWQPRLDLMGALPISKAARLPRIAASCVRSDSSFNKRKTPRTTRCKSRGSHAPADHTMGHERSRRLPHQNADDLRPEDLRSWRQPHKPESHLTPTYRDRTSTAEAESNSIKFNVRRHLARAEKLDRKKDSIECSGARLCSSNLTVFGIARALASNAARRSQNSVTNQSKQLFGRR